MSTFLLGHTPFRSRHGEPVGRLADHDGRPGYRIDGVERMPPFLTTVVSAGDAWLYATSAGVLCAGRRDPDGALFPYETDDRMFERDGRSGGRTIVFAKPAERDVPERRWEPFLRAGDGLYDVERSLWRSVIGDELVLTERNDTLALTLHVAYTCDETFGLQRRVRLESHGDEALALRLLDGFVDVQAADVDRGLQDSFSCLVDAYRITELDPDSGLGFFRLNSIPVDRAIPSEALAANVAWARGVGDATIHLGFDDLERFRRGESLEPSGERRESRGKKGAFLVRFDLALAPGATRGWVVGADAGLAAGDATALAARLGARSSAPPSELELAREKERSVLADMVRAADGESETSESLYDARHAANVLYNVMRGGTVRWWAGSREFTRHLARHFPAIYEGGRGVPPETVDEGDRADLIAWAQGTGDPDRERLAREWLPLTFGRRHGDPSRPWNRFSIRTRDESGKRTTGYEGNWRDVFQNWEALLTSYPSYAEAAVFKFLNASTADGFNPYRVTSEGIDWEVPDPADPWAYIGYWGDHQIVYLQRLVDLAERVTPGTLAEHFDRRLFVFADVPYRISGFDALLADPRETIEFDREAHEVSVERAAREGNEGRLLRTASGELARANLAEKLLVPVLAKLSNFVPGIGLWLNTQRPEWNDANNALVGQGVSVVSTCQLHRHLETLDRLLDGAGASIELDAHVAQHVAATAAALVGDAAAAANDPAERFGVLEALGRAGERYRSAVYAREVGGDERATVSRDEVRALFRAAREWLAATVRASRREDGLWHGYNLLDLSDRGRVHVRRLPVMLEGQVAAIASGVLDAREVLGTVRALRKSSLWREDLSTYLLYPDQDVDGFSERGRLSDETLAALPDVDELLGWDKEGQLLRRSLGGVHFAPGLADAGALAARMDVLQKSSGAVAPRLRDWVARHRDALLAAYEATFDHAAFTGRSGTFFGYEGLGSVYWHMVSKLRLAVAEVVAGCGPDDESLAGLVEAYHEIRRGLGVEAAPALYGAIPTEPYSHTPAGGGARQPGMTGQVKEDILARWIELGVSIEDGVLRFAHSPLGPSGPANFSVSGTPVELSRVKGLGSPHITVVHSSGEEERFDGDALDPATSRAVLMRTGEVTELRVEQPA